MSSRRRLGKKTLKPLVFTATQEYTRGHDNDGTLFIDRTSSFIHLSF